MTMTTTYVLLAAITGLSLWCAGVTVTVLRQSRRIATLEWLLKGFGRRP